MKEGKELYSHLKGLSEKEQIYLLQNGEFQITQIIAKILFRNKNVSAGALMSLVWEGIENKTPFSKEDILKKYMQHHDKEYNSLCSEPILDVLKKIISSFNILDHLEKLNLEKLNHLYLIYDYNNEDILCAMVSHKDYHPYTFNREAETFSKRAKTAYLDRRVDYLDTYDAHVLDLILDHFQKHDPVRYSSSIEKIQLQQLEKYESQMSIFMIRNIRKNSGTDKVFKKAQSLENHFNQTLEPFLKTIETTI